MKHGLQGHSSDSKKSVGLTQYSNRPTGNWATLSTVFLNRCSFPAGWPGLTHGNVRIANPIGHRSDALENPTGREPVLSTQEPDASRRTSPWDDFPCYAELAAMELL